jgi:hypothetical protein
VAKVCAVVTSNWFMMNEQLEIKTVISYGAAEKAGKMGKQSELVP